MSLLTAVEKTSSDALHAKWSAWHIGYRPVTTNPDIYFGLLQQVASHVTVSLKRQSPLVNAGYAARMASLAGTVYQFLNHHCDNDNNYPVDIVVLGCGLDILGLWMYSLVKNKGNIRIIEVDTPQVCASKRKVLSELGLIKERQSIDDPETKACRASICLTGSNALGQQVANSDNYILLAGDLRDVVGLEQAFAFRQESSMRPTLVVLELVLAYLGESKIDDLLRFCSTNLCAATGSALVALEPLGPDKHLHPSATSCLSVGQLYRGEYCRQFQTKLARGTASSNQSNQLDVNHVEENCFTPLGHSFQSVEKRLQEAGFQCAYGCSLGVSAAWAQTKWGATLQAPEPFDEHVALLLHLTSYVLVCGFTEQHSSMEMHHGMCGWSKRLMTTLNLRPANVRWGCGDTNCGYFTVSEIQSSYEDDQVREIFRNTYQELFEEYPAVKKLVKSTLKSDLGAERVATGLAASKSSIGVRYRNLDGIFVVATVPGEDQSLESHRRVIGFVGIRAWDNSDENSFEIQRLAVDESFRGKGIGGVLLNAVETSLKAIPRHRCQLFATTPSILTSANELYISNGYELKQSKTIANLTMNTYSKIIKDMT